MKYEFICLDENFKKDNTFYNNNRNTCIDLTKLIENNNNLAFPISVFINGVMLKHTSFKYKNKTITITDELYNLSEHDNDYNLDFSFPTNRVYLLMASSDEENSGLIKQYICKDFNVFDSNSIIVDAGGFKFATGKEIVGITINGIIYGSECFNEPEYNEDLGFVADDGVTIVRKDKITFLESYYRPDEDDNVSLLIIDRR